MDTTAIIDTLVKIIDRLTKQPGALSVRGVEALERIGDTLVDGLQGIKDEIQAESEALAAEIEQIAAKLQGTVTEAEKQEVVNQIRDMTQRIRNIVPDTPDPDPNA